MRELLSQGLFIAVIKTTICLCVFFIFLAILIDFSLYARDDKVQKEKKSIVETGTMTLFFIVICGILYSDVGAIPIRFPYIKEILMIAGTIMIVTGSIVNICGRFHLGRNWSNHIKIYQEHTLVHTGMYKIVRHPLYASIILMFYGASLVYRNIFSFIAISTVFVPFMIYRARQEETLLLQRFPQYKEYKQNTGMIFPKMFKRKGRD